MQLKGELEKGGAKMAIENDIADDRPKVYLETSFFSYLTGRETPVELIALRQNSTRLWWRDESMKYDLFISQHVTTEAADGSPDMAAKRLEACQSLCFAQDHFSRSEGWLRLSGNCNSR